MSLQDCLLWTQRLTAWALLLQSLELLMIRHELSETGVWPWRIVSRDFERWSQPLRSLANWLFRFPNVQILICAQAVGALLFLFVDSSWLSGFLFLTALLISWRWRGNFNGGSDFMTLILLLCLTIAGSTDSNLWKLGALFYLALQSLSSYFVAGFVKLKSPAWREGNALIGFLNLSVFEVPIWLRKVLEQRALRAALCWFLIIFEVSSPVSLLSHDGAVIFVTLAVVFHLMNWFLFGLNRFLWAWAASYPALIFCSYWLPKLLSTRPAP